MSAFVTAPTRTVASGREERERGPAAPIVAAVDASAASRAAIEEAVVLAAELDAPLVFVYARRGPAAFLGAPFYQRRLTKELSRARRVLDRALRIAARAGVAAEGEILEGSPAQRITELAQRRGAHALVVGSRRRRFGRSVAWAIARAAELPVIIARRRSAGRDTEALAQSPSSTASFG